jgi:hypothetical protein
MKITHMFTGPDGQTHFTDLDMPTKHASDSGRDVIEYLPSVGAGLGESTRERAPLDFHNAPRRQIVTILTGGIEMSTGDGTTRQFHPGEMFLADDLTGQGHKTRDLAVPTKVMYVYVADDFDPSVWKA